MFHDFHFSLSPRVVSDLLDEASYALLFFLIIFLLGVLILFPIMHWALFTV